MADVDKGLYEAPVGIDEAADEEQAIELQRLGFPISEINQGEQTDPEGKRVIPSFKDFIVRGIFKRSKSMGLINYIGLDARKMIQKSKSDRELGTPE